MDVGLSLGSNVGDRLANLAGARDRIADLPGVTLAAVSPVYETEPVDVEEQHKDAWFLNAVVIVGTEIPLEDLQRELHAIEHELGRVRPDDRNAPRTLDIDVICADCPPRHSEALTVPHPRWKERRFVAEPLAAVRPDWHIPGESQTPAQALAALPAGPAAAVFARKW